jgi:hypothetical protein
MLAGWMPSIPVSVARAVGECGAVCGMAESDSAIGADSVALRCAVLAACSPCVVVSAARAATARSPALW